MKKTKE